MRLLLCGDLHGQKRTLEYLKFILSTKPLDGAIFTGDYVSFGEQEFLDEILKIIDESKIPSFMIWGNCDDSAIAKKISNSKFNSHLSLRLIGKYKIFGLSDTDDIPIIDPNVLNGAIFLTHRPPLKMSLNRKLKGAPKFHICGHIHNLAKLTKFESTTLIQVPALEQGRYGIFDIDNSTVEFKRI